MNSSFSFAMGVRLDDIINKTHHINPEKKNLWLFIEQHHKNPYAFDAFHNPQLCMEMIANITRGGYIDSLATDKVTLLRRDAVRHLDVTGWRPLPRQRALTFTFYT